MRSENVNKMIEMEIWPNGKCISSQLQTYRNWYIMEQT